jgi:hypothetical protein
MYVKVICAPEKVKMCIEQQWLVVSYGRPAGHLATHFPSATYLLIPSPIWREKKTMDILLQLTRSVNFQTAYVVGVEVIVRARSRTPNIIKIRGGILAWKLKKRGFWKNKRKKPKIFSYEKSNVIKCKITNNIRRWYGHMLQETDMQRNLCMWLIH